MSSKSKAGIYVDVKELLVFTYRMHNEMSNADKRNFGDKLISLNLEMIKATSDIKEGVKLLDTITRKGIIKDYENLKIARA